MILGLDGIRAIAFFLVFLVHTDYMNFGWVGVQLFFVLSGFLITGILLDMKQRFPSLDYFVRFYGRRFLRIFPLYYFYLLIMLVITIKLSSLGIRIKEMKLYPSQLSYALAYVYNFYYAHVSLDSLSLFLAHFWSLSVEEQFYIVWPLLIFIVPEKWLKKMFVGVVVAGPLFRLLFTIIYQVHPLKFFGNGLPHGIYPLPLSHIDAFGLGALITYYKIPQARKQFWLLLFLIPVVGFVTQYVSTGSIGSLGALGYPFQMENGYQFIWGYSLLDYWFAVAISAVINENALVRFLEWPPLKYLGKISYGLYVYHLGIIWFAHRLLENVITTPQPITKFLFAVLEFLVTLIVATISFYFLEKPILTLKDKYFSVRRQAAAPALER